MTTNGKSPLQLLVEERTSRDVEELLRELYLERRWTHQEIATHLSDERLTIQRTTVVAWCRSYGIDRANRTTDLATAEPTA